MSDAPRRRGGRPRKPAGTRQKERLWMFVTEEEFDRVIRRALRRGETVSEFLRRHNKALLAPDRA